MKKVININFQGQVIAIEETAYEILKHYIKSLKRYFSGEEDGEEIVNDIESRIAELFGNRLKLGINCITADDVQSIISSIGRPEDFDKEYREESFSDTAESEQQKAFSDEQSETAKAEPGESRSLHRNRNDGIIAGVCSGLAHYFKIDPVGVRIVFVLFFSVLFWVYLVLWVVLKPKDLEANVSKRLYRNPNDRFLGGVCSGIAAYFKIDSWIPRLLFVAPFLLNLMGMISIPFFPWNRFFDNLDFNWNINTSVIVLYAVLWVIIPRATTVKQKLEMMGEEEYIKSIREKVSDNIASVKNRSEGDENIAAPGIESCSTTSAQRTDICSMPPEPPRSHSSKSAGSRTAEAPGRGCLRILTVFFKILFFAFAGILTVTLTGMLIALLVAGTRFVPMKSLFVEPGYENSLFWISAALIFLVPVISVVVWILRRSMRAKSRPVIGVVASVFWTVGVVGAATLGFGIFGKFKMESSVEKVQTLGSFEGEKLYVDMDPYLSDYYSFSSGFGPGTDWDDFLYCTVNEDSLLFPNISLQIVQSHDSLFHVRTISSSSGKDLKVAQKNARQFVYNIRQRDSLLLLPEFFEAPISQGFRGQAMIVEIATPSGKKIEIDERLDSYRNSSSVSRVGKRMRKRRRNIEILDWNYGEEYILKNGKLSKTVLFTDTI